MPARVHQGKRARPRPLQVEGDVVATATFTLSCQYQQLFYLPDEFGAVQMVLITSSGGTPGPFTGMPAGEVHLCDARAISGKFL